MLLMSFICPNIKRISIYISQKKSHAVLTFCVLVFTHFDTKRFDYHSYQGQIDWISVPCSYQIICSYQMLFSVRLYPPFGVHTHTHAHMRSIPRRNISISLLVMSFVSVFLRNVRCWCWCCCCYWHYLSNFIYAPNSISLSHCNSIVAILHRNAFDKSSTLFISFFYPSHWYTFTHFFLFIHVVIDQRRNWI